MSRRDDLLDAAIDVLASRGGRGLTHRAVDSAAAVAAGTTSNYFRTRSELLRGTRNRLVERQAAASTSTPPAPATEDELVQALADVLIGKLDDRTETIAHTILLFTAVSDEDLRAGLHTEVDHLRTTFASWLAPFGVDDPERAAMLLVGYVYSLMFGEHIEPAPDFDAREAVEPVVRGFLAG